MLARVYRDPWDTMREVRGELERRFNHNAAAYMDTASDWVPSVDIKETKDAYQLSADVPGVDPKDIDVCLEDGVLSVKGERKAEIKDEGEGEAIPGPSGYMEVFIAALPCRIPQTLKIFLQRQNTEC